jgi:hypothetical protein
MVYKISMFIFLSFISAAQADSNALILPLSIQVSANKKISAFNPNEKSIFAINVDYKPSGTSGTQDVLFYIDGRYEKEFKNQVLPFTFQYNLRGRHPGAHELRIDVIDQTNAEKVLGRASVTVTADPN